MARKPTGPLRRGWTTGACATAAVKAALLRLRDGTWGDTVSITLPKGETPVFVLETTTVGEGWAEAGIIKDAGDDPDVTHGALIKARVELGGNGVSFHAGEGVGHVTKAGLPIAVGEPAINPVPRAMMDEVIAEIGWRTDVRITISVPNGAAIAQKTWNPRLGFWAVFRFWAPPALCARLAVRRGSRAFTAVLMWPLPKGCPMWRGAQARPQKKWCNSCTDCLIMGCSTWAIFRVVC
jgi:hypothetical protein